MEKEPAFADCRVHRLSALAPGPSLLAAIAAGANYSADGFIANFLMGPALSDSVFSQGIPHSQPCLFVSCWAFSGLSIENGSVVVTEEESERCWQAKCT